MTYGRIVTAIRMTLAVFAAAIAVSTAPDRALAQSQQDLMKVCADEWNNLKSANRTDGKIYQDFVKECLAKLQGSAKPSVTGTVNLNTASVAELDALPLIGKVHSKAIIEERTKGKFKNWDDFVARKIVPSNTEGAIKGFVRF